MSRQEAEEYLQLAVEWQARALELAIKPTMDDDRFYGEGAHHNWMMQWLAIAQVHATIALAEATLGDDGARRSTRTPTRSWARPSSA